MTEPMLVMNPVMETLLSSVHVLCWSVYVGGAVCMELVLRHAQNFMKPSQIAVVCERSGRRYRWWSFLCLMLLLATGLPLALTSPGAFDPATGYGALVLILCGLWLLLISLLALLSFRIHPDMHARLQPSMNAEEIKRERARVGVAIVRMDRTVRLELACAMLALFAGSLLHLDSMNSAGS